MRFDTNTDWADGIIKAAGSPKPPPGYTPAPSRDGRGRRPEGRGYAPPRRYEAPPKKEVAPSSPRAASRSSQKQRGSPLAEPRIQKGAKKKEKTDAQ